MKVIILNESQFRKLLEQSGNGDSQFLDGNDTIKRFQNLVPKQMVS